MNIEVDISGLEELVRRLDPDVAREALARGFERGIARAAAHIQSDKLSGDPLNQRSGRLSQSVGHPTVEASGDTMTATIGGPFYGGVQEFGATIEVNSAVNLPDIGWRHLGTVVLPARPWLRPGIEERMDDIGEQMHQALKEAVDL